MKKIVKMKYSVLFLSALAILVSCKSNTEEKQEITEDVEAQELYMSIGSDISADGAISKEEMAAIYENLKPGDTVEVKFVSTVDEVCQNKGCWMKMDLGEEQAMIKFKDYAFFMPKDLAGKEVILNGKAYIEEMSVDEQQHYAEDAGKSEDEIAKITEPKQTRSFLSDGVLIVQ